MKGAGFKRLEDAVNTIYAMLLIVVFVALTYIGHLLTGGGMP